MTILGIDEITYGASDLDTCRRFFADWGLALLEDGGARLVFETANGGKVIVADPERVDLPLAIEAGPTLREVVWGVSDAASLAHLRLLLIEQPGFVDDGRRVGCTDPMGLSLRFQIGVKRDVAVAGTPSNTWDKRQRIDQPSPVYERAAPVEVGHVVFFVSHLDETEAFYARLGFVTSDRYPGHGVFMRCAQRGGHHDLFLLRRPGGQATSQAGNQSPNPCGLNHVAFAVRDIHEVFGGGLHISRCGWATQLGPGRHPISSAYFWYFKCPAGGLIEYYADDDELTEAWQPREFTPGPTVFAEWAIAGGIDGHTRRQVGHAVDNKFLTEKR